MRKWTLVAILLTAGVVSVGCGANMDLVKLVDKRIDNLTTIAANGSGLTDKQRDRIREDGRELKVEVHQLAGVEDTASASPTQVASAGAK